MADEETRPEASITNIYYDCLERIYDFLDLENLLNLAGSCKRLQIAAAAKFSHEHGKKRIILRFPENRRNREFLRMRLMHNMRMRLMHNMHIPDRPGERDEISVRREAISVTGLKLQLPFLRCFGAKISHLDFIPGREYAHKSIFDQYINQYCADTLTSFTIRGKKIFTVEKPFKNLEKLMIEDGDLNEMFRNYVNWYPNLRHLELVSVNVRVPRIRPLENLEKLIIKNTDLAEKLACFIDWFPNLRHLELDYVDIHMDGIAVSLPQLEHLGISMSQSSMEHIASLLKSNLQLQSLDIRMTDKDIRTKLTMLLDMIRAHQSISKLKVTLVRISKVRKNDLLQLMNDHSLIAELSLQQYQFTENDAVDFIRQLKSLKKFEFCVKDETQCNRIQNHLNDEWQFEHRRVERDEFDVGDPVYAIVLNRNR